MNFKELLQKNSGRTASSLSLTNFKLNLSKTRLKTPHYIMDRVYDMIEGRPSIKSALDQLTLFTLNKVTFESEDAESVRLVEEWWKKRSFLIDEIELEKQNFLGPGTSYIEPVYNNNNPSEGINTFYAVPDSSKIYLNIEADEDSDDYWLLEVPLNVSEYGGQKPRFYNFNYVKGEYYGTRQIYAVGYPKHKFIRRLMKGGRDPNYGWGLLSSAVDNDDVLREILKNWALMSKYRALARKIIGVYNHNGDPVDADEIESLQDDFRTMEEEDSIIVNKRIESTDLSFTGQDNSMEREYVDVHKEIGSSLVPNFMGPFSQDSSLATAREAKVPFTHKINSLVEKDKRFYQEIIVEQGVKKVIPGISDDLTISFGDSELYDWIEKVQIYLQLYNNRNITFNELRKNIGLSTVEGGDVWGEEPPKVSVNVRKNEEVVKESKKFKESLKIIKESVVNPKPKTKVKLKTQKEMEKFKENIKNDDDYDAAFK